MNRRDFIRASTGGLAAATIPAAGSGKAADNIVGEGRPENLRSASSSDLQGLVGDGQQRRILLRGGVVLSLDPRVGDFEKADVLIDGKRIAEIAPTVSAGDAEIVDCTGTIVMPGFIATHHHQYETLQRSIIPDGLLQGAWPHRRSCESKQCHLGPGSCAVRPGGLLHLGARRMPQRNQRGHHHGNRYLSVLAYTRTHRRDDQGSDGVGPADGLCLLPRYQSQQRWYPARVSRSDE